MAFRCFTTIPADLPHHGLAIASTRAGATALLDLEWAENPAAAGIQTSLARWMEEVPEGHWGLRLRAVEVDRLKPLRERLAGRSHTLLLCQWQPEQVAALGEAVRAVEGAALWLEVRDYESFDAVQRENLLQPDAWVVRGSECGGFTGRQGAFVLSQRLLAASEVPIYVQGGIGLHSAAACRAAGAAGVGLGDQLLLMPEVSLRASTRAILERLGGEDTVVVGDVLGNPCRIAGRPDLPAAKELMDLAETLEREPEIWHRELRRRVRWGDPAHYVWPVGQDLSLAASLRDRFHTTGHLLRALMAASEEHLAQGAALNSLAPHGPLAQSHGTLYPIVQGPMTRVSDGAEFVAAVAEAGALPFLALALMRREAAGALLRETRERVGEKPWGVGILGFVPPEIRQEQLACLRENPPPVALIAGGRPDQAAELEAEGVATYLHVPSPALLEDFFARGARRFVFEGRECGGHVGPFSSFCLWDSMVQSLLDIVPPDQASKVHILFAGGIHDARSAAMIGALAAPLAARGDALWSAHGNGLSLHPGGGGLRGDLGRISTAGPPMS